MAEKNVVKVTEPIADIFGYLGDGEKYFSPVFEELKVPKKQQYSVYLTPMSDEDCIAIDTLNRQESSLSTMLTYSHPKLQASQSKVVAYDPKTSKEKAIPTMQDVENCYELQRLQKVNNKNTEKFMVVQKYITKLSEPHPLTGEGVIDDKAWLAMPIAIKKSYYTKIYNMSNLNQDDIINLQ